MKRRISAGLLAVTLLLTLTACGGKKTTTVTPAEPVEEVPPSAAELAVEAFLSQYEGTEETAEETALLDTSVTLTAESAEALAEALATVDVTYPYADITNLQDSYDRYLVMAAELPWQDSADYGGLSRLPLKDGELLAIVKANNEEFLAVRSIENSLYRPLDDEYLAWVCQVLTDTLNRELTERDFGAQRDSIDWTIANLKILRGPQWIMPPWHEGRSCR